MRFLDRIIGTLRGHKLAVLGEREVGKTHLQTFLRTGKIPTAYLQTVTQTSLRPGRAHLMAFENMEKATQAKIAIKTSDDVQGAAEATAAWKEVIDEASILIYLFRADHIWDGDEYHAKRVRDDAKLISDIVRRDSLGFKAAALVGTHYDLVPGYRGPDSGSAFYKFHMEIENAPVIQESLLLLSNVTNGGTSGPPGLVVGSMKDWASTQELAFRLFVRELNL
jgi:hypothetical protein